MTLNKIPSGKSIPEDIYVIIEIPAQKDPIKYEVNKKNGILFVDRFIPTRMSYPCNYGYINNTLSTDKDPLDVLVKTPYAVSPGAVIRSRPIGVLNMLDEAGEDKKIIAVPHTKLCHDYDHVKDIKDLPAIDKMQIFHFFQHYKDLEKNKWVKILNWSNVEDAKNEILEAHRRAERQEI